jgi:hypothetical protein
MPATGSPTATEAAYYQGVEEFFVSRRGDPLLLSNADWLLIREWRLAGVPLRIVLRGIGDALDGHAHSFSRARKVGSLRYCAAEVLAAKERWERALASGGDALGDPAHRIEALAQELDSARGLGPEASTLAAGLARGMRERAALLPRELEAWLVAQEAGLLGALSRETASETLEGIERDVDGGLAPYRDRMPRRVLDQIKADALARRLLESHGLRRISLFVE